MSEFELIAFCESCKRGTMHLFSGSGGKRVCTVCGDSDEADEDGTDTGP
jgi:hypothetical protein